MTMALADITDSTANEALTAYAMLIGMKIVLFIIGYLIIRLGYNLLLAGTKGQFKFKTSIAGIKADLASVSPGLLFVLLGVLLDCYAIAVDKPIKTSVKTDAQDAPFKGEPPKGSIK
jgi:hypothetical protein